MVVGDALVAVVVGATVAPIVVSGQLPHSAGQRIAQKSTEHCARSCWSHGTGSSSPLQLGGPGVIVAVVVGVEVGVVFSQVPQRAGQYRATDDAEGPVTHANSERRAQSPGSGLPSQLSTDARVVAVLVVVDVGRAHVPHMIGQGTATIRRNAGMGELQRAAGKGSPPHSDGSLSLSHGARVVRVVVMALAVVGGRVGGGVVAGHFPHSAWHRLATSGDAQTLSDENTSQLAGSAAPLHVRRAGGGVVDCTCGGTVDAKILHVLHRSGHLSWYNSCKPPTTQFQAGSEHSFTASTLPLHVATDSVVVVVAVELVLETVVVAVDVAVDVSEVVMHSLHRAGHRSANETVSGGAAAEQRSWSKRLHSVGSFLPPQSSLGACVVVVNGGQESQSTGHVSRAICRSTAVSLVHTPSWMPSPQSRGSFFPWQYVLIIIVVAVVLVVGAVDGVGWHMPQKAGQALASPGIIGHNLASVGHLTASGSLHSGLVVGPPVVGAADDGSIITMSGGVKPAVVVVVVVVAMADRVAAVLVAVAVAVVVVVRVVTVVVVVRVVVAVTVVVVVLVVVTVTAAVVVDVVVLVVVVVVVVVVVTVAVVVVVVMVEVLVVPVVSVKDVSVVVVVVAHLSVG